MAKIMKFTNKNKRIKNKLKTIDSFTRQRSTQNFSFPCHTEWDIDRKGNIRALLEIRYDRFSRGFERDSKAGCGRQHNEAAWPELHARRNAIRLI